MPENLTHVYCDTSANIQEVVIDEVGYENMIDVFKGGNVALPPRRK